MNEEILVERRGAAGLVTLNRPQALNALSLGMIRQLTATLLAWRDDPEVEVVAVRGMGKAGPFGAFCAGGDIRYFHRAALAGDPTLEDFFTEEYALNHLVHHYPKPYVVFLDGVVMGGGMGISGHGSTNALRIATPRTKMAMPETNIGLFPDVGGGWFLGRCPGHIGEYLALTGQVIHAADACEAGLADGVLAAEELAEAWEALDDGAAAAALLRERVEADRPAGDQLAARRAAIDGAFALGSVRQVVAALEAAAGEWESATAAQLRQRSPLMLHVTLEQLRRARQITLSEALRLERGLVRHAFHLRPGSASETIEGIRALAVDKDHAPRWNPARLEDVTPEQVAAFFASPWPAHAHPLRSLAD